MDVGRSLVQHVSEISAVRSAVFCQWQAESGGLVATAYEPERAAADQDRLLSRYGTALRDLAQHTHRTTPETFAIDTTDGVFAVSLVDGRRDVLGLLVLWDDSGTRLFPRQRRLIEMLAFQAAVALRRIAVEQQKHAALLERLRVLETFEAVSRRMSSTLDMDVIASDVLDVAVPVVGAETARCVLVPSMMDARVGARFDPYHMHTPETLNVNVRLGLVGQVLRSAQPVVLQDVSQGAAPIDMSLAARAVLAAPIMRDWQVIGVLIFESMQPFAFTEEHVQFVTTLARHAAISLDNAQLYQQVRAGRDQLQALLDSTHEAMILFDAHGRLRHFNPVAEALLGHNLSRYLDRNFVCWMRDFGPERLKRLGGLTLDQVREYIKGVRARPEEVRCRKFAQPNGDTPRYIEETGSPVLDQGGQLAGWLLVWRDATEDRQLEQMREQLTSMIVHDLRNPITSISSSLLMLRDLIDDERVDSATLLELVTLAHSSADYLTNLVQSILDVARLEQHTVSLDCESWSLADSVDYAIKSVFSLVLAANLEIATDIPDNLPLVWIDDEKIRRVLINLLDNAVRHTPQDGCIRISARYDAKQNVVVACVSDTGPGIPHEARGRIFEKFIQLDQQAIRGHKGTGLGLAFCRLAVEAHGGQIWVEDAAGGGAAFCFTLPLIPPGADLFDDV